jgi:hypothetical protein
MCINYSRITPPVERRVAKHPLAASLHVERNWVLRQSSLRIIRDCLAAGMHSQCARVDQAALGPPPFQVRGFRERGP